MARNEVPEKIYMSKTEPRLIYKSCKNLRYDIEYIRKDVVDKMIEEAKYSLLMRQISPALITKGQKQDLR